MKLLTLFGQPIHQRINDIPVGLWVLSFVWDLVALSTRTDLWRTLSFWTLLAGVAVAIPVAVTGFVDFLQIPREHAAKATAIYHLLAIAAASGCFTASLALRWPTGGLAGPTALVVGLSAAGVVLLSLGTWLGGELILRYGIGRRAAVYAGPERRRVPREPVFHE